MTTRSPIYAYVLAIVFGLVAFVFSPDDPFFVMLGLVYFLGGALCGFLWPRNSWRWGLWIAAPMLVLLGLSVLFAGQLKIFFEKDLPPALLALGAACLGSFLAAWYKRTRTNSG